MIDAKVPFSAVMAPGVIPANLQFDPACTAMGMFAIAAIMSDMVMNFKDPRLQHLMPNLLFAVTPEGQWGATITAIDKRKVGQFSVSELDNATTDLGQGCGNTPWEAAHDLMVDLAMRHNVARGDIAGIIKALVAAAVGRGG